MTSVSLPSDLVMNIMSRIPGKSLARFRLVSKQFRSLLSGHCFLRLHHNRSRDSLFATVLFHMPLHCPLGPREFHQRRYDFFVSNKANCLVHDFTVCGLMRIIRMLSSHHQLVCFVCLEGIHLCNPVNKELKNLPDPPSSPRCFNGSQKCLISFGFVEATMQYKVVKWPHDLDENCTRLPSGQVNQVNFEVLDIDIVEDGRLKVSRWRSLHRPCPYLLQLSSHVQVNGFIYWTTSDFKIVSFSLQDETFSSVNPTPPCFCLDTQVSKKSRFFKLFGSRRNLWMMDIDDASQIMDIWKMDESRDRGWAKNHTIDLSGTKSNENGGKVLHMLDIRSDQVFNLSSTCLLCYDLVKYGSVSRDYQPCHSTDGLLSLHNIDMSNSFPSSSLPFESLLGKRPR